ncbi:MAG: hypothetical protein R2748_03155 [Bryobacterales bacterium]
MQPSSLGQLLRSYPQFSGVSHQRGQEYHSTYHSLQTKVRQRFKNGLHTGRPHLVEDDR